MDALFVAGGIFALLTLLTEVPSFDERKRFLNGSFEYLRAKIDDTKNIKTASSFSASVHRTKKRSRDSDLCNWMAEGQELLTEAESLLTQVQECRSFIMRAKKRKVINQVVGALAVHAKKGDMLMMNPYPDEQGPYRGYHIPVQEIIGQAAIRTLEELGHLLKDAKVGRVAIRGREGIGKTFLMKHLHNCAVKWVERFDYVFWVTSPDEFSIKHVQDAVAAAVKCDLSSVDDSIVRAEILSNTLSSFGSVVIFLDGAPKSDLSLNDIGIPVHTKGSECKLVLTTNSALGYSLLDGFATVELGYLSENEAFELLLHEAKINTNSVTLLKYIRLLAEQCNGVPGLIVNLATRMCNIEDLHEWRTLLFELGV